VSGDLGVYLKGSNGAGPVPGVDRTAGGTKEGRAAKNEIVEWGELGGGFYN